MFKSLHCPTSASTTLAVMLLVGLTLTTSDTARGQFTGWDFEDGTLQGWTNVPTPNIASLYQRVVDTVPTPLPIEMGIRADPGTGTTWRPNGYQQGGMYLVSPTPFNPSNSATDGRDGAHDLPIVLRSPTFELRGSGHIGAHLLGGSQGAAVVTPNNYSELGGVSINTNGLGEAGDSSYLGLALRRNSTGDYLLHTARSNNSSASYQQVLFDEASLATVAATYPGELFTLDLIDTAHGTFGSLSMDTVTIPAASGPSIITGGGTWSVLERLSAGTVTNIAAMDTLLALPEGDPGILFDNEVYQADFINIDDLTGNPGLFPGTDVFQAGQAAFAMRSTGVINVAEAGVITFGFYANDGGRLTIDGNVVAEDASTDYGSPTLGSITLSAGAHTVQFDYFQNGLGATTELFVATSVGDFTSFDQSSWELLAASDLEPPMDLLGDYNNDGQVNLADYTVWRDNLGGTSLENEGASLGTVDAEDYTFWKSQFGNSNGAGSVQAAQVPEPHAIALLAISLPIALLGRRRIGGNGLA